MRQRQHHEDERQHTDGRATDDEERAPRHLARHARRLRLPGNSVSRVASAAAGVVDGGGGRFSADTSRSATAAGTLTGTFAGVALAAAGAVAGTGVGVSVGSIVTAAATGSAGFGVAGFAISGFGISSAGRPITVARGDGAASAGLPIDVPALGRSVVGRDGGGTCGSAPRIDEAVFFASVLGGGVVGGSGRRSGSSVPDAGVFSSPGASIRTARPRAAPATAAEAAAARPSCPRAPASCSRSPRIFSGGPRRSRRP